MDSRKPLSNISNHVCCRSSLIDENLLYTKEDPPFFKDNEKCCIGQPSLLLHSLESSRLYGNKQRELADNNEDENVSDYLRKIIEAESSNDVFEERSLNRTTNKFSWPCAAISKSKRKKSLDRRRTIDGKQILYKAYEKARSLMIPDGVTTWRHFV